jgi:uncharacterized paraquat-inducible protein A
VSYEKRKKYAAVTILLNAVPGLGHLLAGRPGPAVLWLAAVLGGYSLYLLPGLFLHGWSTWSLVKYWHEELERRQQAEQREWTRCQHCGAWAESAAGQRAPRCQRCGAMVERPDATPPALSKAA